MQTCKVGENIINCFDGTYDKFQLKKWSDKNILICPDCNKPYEYCHGQIIPPYFRHKEKNKECEGIYSEPETKEHIEGKLILYNWLFGFQEQGIIQNLKLEGYIPETKQRPDIYFECNSKKFVVEFQCSPIATEYLERHELYQLANVNDIWILGTQKYNFTFSEDGDIYHNQYYKTIEKHTDFCLNTEKELVYVKYSYILSHLNHKRLPLGGYYKYNLNDFDVINNFSLRKHIIDDFILKDNKFYEERMLIYAEQEKQRLIRKEIVTKQKELVDSLNFIYSKNNNEILFTYKDGNSPYYLWGINFESPEIDYTFFIKEDSVDCCKQYYKRLGKIGYNNIGKHKHKELNNDSIKKFVLKYILPVLNKIEYEKERKDKYLKLFSKFLNKEITLVNGSKEKINYDFRFKFLKGFNISDDYMEKIFIQELQFLEKKTSNQFIFMIPKYHHYYNNLGFDRYVRINDFNRRIIDHFKSYGFKNVKFLEEE
jgi:competence CoiA-like predicted nuclease